MKELFFAAALAFGVALVLGPLLLPVLRRLKFGQSIREEGPKGHYAKAGTPTMGGVLILAALTISSLFFAGGSRELWLVLFITAGHGVIGFLDDYIKVALKRSLGLKARQKLVGQILLAAVLAYTAIVFFRPGNGVMDSACRLSG